MKVLDGVIKDHGPFESTKYKFDFEIKGGEGSFSTILDEQAFGFINDEYRFNQRSKLIIHLTNNMKIVIE